MPDILTVSAAGSRIGIRLSGLSDAAAMAVTRVWSDARTDGVPDALVMPMSGDDERAMLSLLSQQVTLAAIEKGRGEGWMLHAAGVATPEGHVIVLVGPSGRGKTTAARVLGRHLGYVSDETIAVDADGTVHPYRKPLSIITEGARDKSQEPPSSLALKPLPAAPLRVAVIALLDRRPEHEGAPVVEDVDLGDALGELVEQSSYLTHHPAPLRQIAALVESTGGVRRLVYREAEELHETVRALAAASEPAAPALRPEVDLASGPASVVRSDREPRYSRVAVADALEIADPDRLALMTIDRHRHGMVRVLAGIGPAVWRAARSATLAELTDAALEAHGHPGEADPRAAVEAVVADLLNDGLLLEDEAEDEDENEAG